MKDWWKIIFGMLCGLLSAGVILLTVRQPNGAPILLRPAPTPTPVTIYLVGAVQNPGVYTLPPGSRVQDAIQAAGGLLPEANPQGLNLAALLEDGERILAPSLAETRPDAETQPALLERSKTLDFTTLININTATQTELEQLPGIGPKTAQKIIEYRETYGVFIKIEDILDVPGIGDKTFAEIKDLITIDG